MEITVNQSDPKKGLVSFQDHMVKAPILRGECHAKTECRVMCLHALFRSQESKETSVSNLQTKQDPSYILVLDFDS